MCIDVYVCICIFVCVCVYIYIHIYIYIYIYIRTDVTKVCPPSLITISKPKVGALIRDGFPYNSGGSL